MHHMNKSLNAIKDTSTHKINKKNLPFSVVKTAGRALVMAAPKLECIDNGTRLLFWLAPRLVCYFANGTYTICGLLSHASVSKTHTSFIRFNQAGMFA